MKKPIGSQGKNADPLEGSEGLALLKETDLEATHNVRFEEGAYFEAVVDMDEWF